MREHVRYILLQQVNMSCSQFIEKNIQIEYVHSKINKNVVKSDIVYKYLKAKYNLNQTRVLDNKYLGSDILNLHTISMGTVNQMSEPKMYRGQLKCPPYDRI